MARARTSSRSRRRVKQPGSPFTATDVQRHYRELLDFAKEQPVQIVDSDGALLVVEDWQDSTFHRALCELFANVAQFNAAYAHHQDENPKEWAAESPYPWLASLTPEEIIEFAHELLAYALDAASRGTLDNVEGNIAAWRSTAELYEQPEILNALVVPIDYSKLEEVFPPSEEEASAA